LHGLADSSGVESREKTFRNVDSISNIDGILPALSQEDTVELDTDDLSPYLLPSPSTEVAPAPNPPRYSIDR
jgi:hypothetical protein